MSRKTSKTRQDCERSGLPSLLQNEDNERLAALATSYGPGTRSYNRSAEKRELDRQRKEATAKHLAQPRAEYVIGPYCNCRSFRFPHELKAHEKLRDDRDWRSWEERRTRYEGWET